MLSIWNCILKQIKRYYLCNFLIFFLSALFVEWCTFHIFQALYTQSVLIRADKYSPAPISNWSQWFSDQGSLLFQLYPNFAGEAQPWGNYLWGKVDSVKGNYAVNLKSIEGVMDDDGKVSLGIIILSCYESLTDMNSTESAFWSRQKLWQLIITNYS